jgi:serine/threonine protein kinase
MNLDTWKRIREVFDAVVDLPVEQRHLALAVECAGDEPLRRKVESLLLCEQDSGLVNLVQGSMLSAVNGIDPSQIGNYKIQARLGEGGMGVVYQAEQLHPKRKVAIKVMRSGHMATDREKRLFEREAEALGRLDHGGIAGIYESGLTAEGQPYLVMEFIEGQTLSQKILAEGPPPSFRPADLNPRIQLFLEICDAITYAHQRGVIHRDLKPSNIMVSGGKLKVLDFGLARLTDELDHTRTETGIVQGSLRYMSPEQAKGEAGRIDVRSDVYSLSVILYEMISGLHPYLDKTDLLGAVQQICEAPMRPLHLIRKPVDADLDTILAKAMSKDPKQRYDSAGAFAGDLRRYLANEPILARPASLGYQLRKLLERNLVLSSAFALVAVLVLVFGAVLLNQALSIRVERDRANQEAATASEVSSFLVNLFRETNPTETNGVLTAKDLLLAGRKRLSLELKDKPELRARLLDNMGDAFNVVGPTDQAVKSFEESIQIRGADALASTKAWTGLSDSYYNLGNYKESAKASRRALEIKQKHLAPEDPRIAAEMKALASSLAAAGELKEAAAMFSHVTDLDLKFGRETTLAAAQRLAGYGSVLRRMDKNLEAVEKLQNAVARMEKFPKTSSLLKAWNDLGMALNSAGRFAQAESCLRKAFDGSKQIFGPKHANVGILGLNIVASQLGQKKFDEAQAGMAIVREILDASLPASHPSWSDVWGTQAKIFEGKGNFTGAAQSWDRALDHCRSTLGPTDYRTLKTAILRSKNRLKLGKAAEVKTELEPILSNLAAGGEDHQIASNTLAEAVKILSNR